MKATPFPCPYSLHSADRAEMVLMTQTQNKCCFHMTSLYQNSENLWRARLLFYIAYFNVLHALGAWLAVNAICCCWGDFNEWICAVHDASSTSQEMHLSKVYRIWLYQCANEMRFRITECPLFNKNLHVIELISLPCYSAELKSQKDLTFCIYNLFII